MTGWAEISKRLAVKAFSETEAEAAGYDAGLNGSNTDNCHFAHFATPEKTKAWERGNQRGIAARNG